MRIFNQRRVKLAQHLDRGLKPLYPIIKRIFPAHPIREVKRVLIFEAFLLGDFIMATPAFRLLRQQFPDAHIDCLSPPALAGLEPFFPWLDNIIPFRCPWSPQYRDYSYQNLYRSWQLAMRLRRNGYDWAFDLRGDLRDIFFLYTTGATCRAAFAITGAGDLLTHVIPYKGQPFLHQVEGNLLVASYPFSDSLEPSQFYCSIWIPPEWQQAAALWLDDHGIHEFVAIHPGASMAHKLWPAASWAQLLDEVILPRFPIVLFGTASEAGVIDQITGNLKLKNQVHRAQVPLPLFFSLTSLARGMVSLDSAAAHVAAATNTPIVALLGPSPAWFSGPYSPVARSVYLDNVPCRPCLKACIQARNFCMQDLTVPMVVSALRDVGIL
jgi:ADP-heptose:LPS heptosyltransferase